MEKKAQNPIIAWIIKLFKGIAIGTGFILPGVSGGVFAVIFGVYEPMIRFFANIRKDFWKNVKFFFPIGVGVLISMILCSKVLDVFFKQAEVPVIWFFVGCVVATVPTISKQAGKQGRSNKHFVYLVIAMAATCAFLIFIKSWFDNNQFEILSDNPISNFFVWLMAGALMGLGAIVPGLSPSNFLLYMNLYDKMTERIGGMEWMVIIPIVLGAGICFLSLSKAFDKLLDKSYTTVFHCILGVVIASTILIIPLPGMPGMVLESGLPVQYDAGLIIISAVTCAAGLALGYVMGTLEKKYKSED